MSEDPEIKALAATIFDEMLEDIILTSAISAHREIKRGRVNCGVCGTQCRGHQPIASTSTSSSTLNLPTGSLPPTRSTSPQPPLATASSSSSQEGRSGGYPSGPEKGTGGSTGVGSGSGRSDGNGNVFFDCLVCGRATVSSKYAPHLASCLGLSGSTRRGAARNAAAKARLGANDRSSPSPYLQSENGDSDADSLSGKKGRKGVINGNGKRGRSPSKPAVSLAKKSKLNAASSGTNTPTSIYPKLPPSKLGQPPTNRQPIGLSSPVSMTSPDFEIMSSQETRGGGGGFTSKKTLPGSYGGSFAGSVMGEESVEGEGDEGGGGELVPGDDSSDGADDY